MVLRWPFGETVTVIRQIENNRGDRSAGDSFLVSGCAVWPPNTGTEIVAGGMDVLTFDLTVLMPPGSDVLSTDKVLVRGTLYDVVGQPAEHRSARTGHRAGIELSLKASAG